MTTEPDRPASPDEKKAVFLAYGQAMATTHVLDLSILGAAMGCAMQAGQLPPAAIAPFLQKHAGRTLGNLAITLRKHAQLSEDTDRLLREVITTRNHLAHHFFATTWPACAPRLDAESSLRSSMSGRRASSRSVERSTPRRGGFSALCLRQTRSPASSNGLRQTRSFARVSTRPTLAHQSCATYWRTGGPRNDAGA